MTLTVKANFPNWHVVCLSGSKWINESMRLKYVTEDLLNLAKLRFPIISELIKIIKVKLVKANFPNLGNRMFVKVDKWISVIEFRHWGITLNEQRNPIICELLTWTLSNCCSWSQYMDKRDKSCNLTKARELELLLWKCNQQQRISIIKEIFDSIRRSSHHHVSFTHVCTWT